MKIAILSDIHDHVWNLDRALAQVQDAGALICCGDLCSPFVVHQLGRGFAGPIHIVFGNNDGDLFRIGANAGHYPQMELHGEWFRGELGGRRVAVNHYDNIGRAVAASGEFDLVCFGHNHAAETLRVGSTLAVNPGTLMGAAFTADGTRKEVDAAYAVYDTETGEAIRHTLAR